MLKAQIHKVMYPFCVCHARIYSNDPTNGFTKKDLYSILGVHPKATRRQIKSAYYNLSMAFHPDKNKSFEASEKFKEITEAYEVLGNYESRKKYDRLAIPYVIYDSSKGSSNFSTGSDDVIYETFEKKPRFTGKSRVYDFDEYYRMHYGRIFQEDMYRKRQREFYKARMNRYEQEMQGKSLDKTELMFAVCAIACLIVNVLVFWISDYDVPINTEIDDVED